MALLLSLLTTLALADEASDGAAREPSSTFRVSVQIDAGDAEGPVWSWERVEVGPCTGELTEAVHTSQHRRWTWLSERDGLHVGVCGEKGDYEVRLEASRRGGPVVRNVFLESGDQQLELSRERGRWIGDGSTKVGEKRDLAFRPEAEARYLELRDALAEAEREEEAEEALELTLDRYDVLDFEDFDGTLFDGADWDMILDGPEGFGSGIGVGAFDEL